MMENSNEREIFYYCFYNVFTSIGHTNKHHVIISIAPSMIDVLNTIDESIYQYRLISAQPVHLDEKEAGSLIIRGLIMDGESLLKRLKRNFKNHSTIKMNEST